MPPTRKQQILEAAMSLFAERGYDGTSVQAIIDAAGVAKGTFYHHFSAKEQLIFAFMEQAKVKIDQIAGPILADEATPAAQRLTRLFLKIDDWTRENPVLMFQLSSLVYHSDPDSPLARANNFGHEVIRAPVCELIEQGQRRGEFVQGPADALTEMILHLNEALQDRLGPLLHGSRPPTELAAQIHLEIHTSEAALERLLGAPKGSIQLIAPDVIDEWLQISLQATPHSKP